MAAHEKLALDAWLIEYLEGDATLAALISGVYSELIPSAKPLPAIRLQLMTAPDVMGIGTHRLHSRMSYAILAVTNAPGPGALAPITTRMDELLQGATGQSATIEVMSAVRTEVISYSTREDGVRYWHVGGMYRFDVNQK
jgi:acyl transferase domain-containing protein